MDNSDIERLHEDIKHKCTKTTCVSQKLHEENKRLTKQVVRYRLMNLQNTQQQMYIMREIRDMIFAPKNTEQTLPNLFLKLIKFANDHEL